MNHINKWRLLVLLPLAILVRAWCATLRFETEEEDRALMQNSPNPTVFLIWHNRLFVAAEIYRRYRKGNPVYALVSASKDGAWLSAFFHLMGIGTVRGSRNFRGTQALREMMNHVKSGKDIAITPDGSKGPMYQLKPGVLMPAKRAGGVVLMSCIFSKSRQLNSWDKFYIPRPFSKVRFLAESISYEDIKKGNSSTEAQATLLENRLLRLGQDNPELE
ncbi:MAG: lysophospholipid acyltransferase family protein [Opitutales bacterium]